MDVMGEANVRQASGEDIIHMEVGQPATPAPRAARERAAKALERERQGYTEALGMPALRERIAGFMGERYGIEISPERLVVTSGHRQASSWPFSFCSIKARHSACRRLAIIPATGKS